MLSTRWRTAHVSRCQLRTCYVHVRSPLADMENVHSLTKISHSPRKNTKILTKIDPICVEAMTSWAWFFTTAHDNVLLYRNFENTFLRVYKHARVDHDTDKLTGRQSYRLQVQIYFIMSFKTAVRHKTDRRTGRLLENPWEPPILTAVTTYHGMIWKAE